MLQIYAFYFFSFLITPQQNVWNGDLQ